MDIFLGQNGQSLLGLSQLPVGYIVFDELYMVIELKSADSDILVPIVVFIKN